MAEELSKKYKFEIVAITIREYVTVWRNSYTSIAYANGTLYIGRKYEMEMVDRLGGGDSFSAGFLYGYLTKKDVQGAIEYGNAFSALKHTSPGDFNFSNLAEVEKLWLERRDYGYKGKLSVPSGSIKKSQIRKEIKWQN